MTNKKMGKLFSCFSSKKEEPKETDQKIEKKPRQYDQIDIVNEPEKNGEGNVSKAEPALNYVEVDIKPSSGATTKVVGSDEHKTQYSTIDIEATEKRKLSTQNTEETI